MIITLGESLKFNNIKFTCDESHFFKSDIVRIGRIASIERIDYQVAKEIFSYDICSIQSSRILCCLLKY